MNHPAPLIYCDIMPEPAQITQWLRILRRNAYVPGSGYQVAAIVMMKAEGGFYFAGGVNVECFEHRLNMHGEESAIAALTTAFGKRAVIDAVWVMAAPDYLSEPQDNPMAALHGQTCGNCRQQIANLARHPDIPVTAITLNGDPMTVNLDVLLPHSFSFADFNPAIAEQMKARLAQIKNKAEDINHRLIRREPQSEDQIFHWLKTLESVDYASGRGQAVVLTLDNGVTIAGVKFENAAYTGQGAMQAALGIAATTFGKITVTAVHSLSTPRGDEDQAGFYPLPLSAYQSLSEFTDAKEIPVILWNGAGDRRVEAITPQTAFARPFL